MGRLILLLTLPLLAACATPRQTCLVAATRDLATVDQLIAETEANLQRGYAIEPEYYTGSQVGLCVGNGLYTGLGWTYCTVPQTRVRARPVTIDRTVEQQKLRDLKKVRVRAEREARTKLESCDATYPQ
ncbi:hypothetical protein [Tropicimonas sp. IMCC6043]|uniref:hypothetical protein n=1 Tax=Tropicimonas sp. IMCC6043 TaxID=2510645 RepID=UPI00101D8369|nr:hypothetical protein [Tropicimonas sp. IMCC6043]RYH08238.1 hypothetical protein EU800_17370 [Tropicimonas sp. IMCC6043]